MNIKMMKKLSKKDRRFVRQMNWLKDCDSADEETWIAMTSGLRKFQSKFKSKQRYTGKKSGSHVVCGPPVASGKDKLTFDVNVRQPNTYRSKILQVKKKKPQHVTSLTRRRRKLAVQAYNRGEYPAVYVGKIYDGPYAIAA